jgi:prefoldin subunit 5
MSDADQLQQIADKLALIGTQLQALTQSQVRVATAVEKIAEAQQDQARRRG